MKIFVFLAFLGLVLCQLTTPRELNFQAYNPADPLVVPVYRPLTGSGNNVLNPTFGAAGSQLLRRTSNAIIGNDTPRGGDPSTIENPRMISNQLFSPDMGVAVGGGVNNPTSLNGYSNLATFQGQFLDHDFSQSLETLADNFPIPVDFVDIFYNPTGMAVPIPSMTVERFVVSVGTGGLAVPPVPREHDNVITSFADLSNVYGSDMMRNTNLRTLVGGTLQVQTLGGVGPLNTYLPINAVGEEVDVGLSGIVPTTYQLAGDTRAGENPALTSYHTLWVREHNRLVVEITNLPNPPVGDNIIYEEARRRAIGIWQNIVFNEWLPLFLGELFDTFAYSATTDAGAFHEATTVCFRFGHSMLTSVIQRRDANGMEITQNDINLAQAFFPDLTTELTDINIDPYFQGLSQQLQNAVDARAVDAVRNTLFADPMSGGRDLIAVNMQRGREVGIPAYNTVRMQVGLTMVADFTGFADSARLMAAYPTGGIAECDLWACGLAEANIGSAVVGETFFTILQEQWNNIRIGDRYYFENSQFLQADLDIISATVFTDVILRNTAIPGLQCHAFTERDACVIGASLGTVIPAPSPAAANTFVFSFIEKTSAHPLANVGSRFGYNVVSNGIGGATGEGINITVTRGTTYTFTSDAACASRLYITLSNAGGRAAAINAPAIVGTEACARPSPGSRSFTFTPDVSTPDVIYYQSRFQLQSGGIINVVDAPTMPTVAPPPDAASAIVVALSTISFLLALFMF